MIVKIITGIVSGVIAIVAIGILYGRWKRSRRREAFDSLQKVEDTNHPGNRVDNVDGTFTPPAEDDTLRPHLYSGPDSSEEALMSYKLDDGPARSNLRLLSAPMLPSTAPVPRSPDVATTSSALDLSRSFVSSAPFVQGSPVTEDIQLDQVQFSRHPRPNFTTRME